MVNLRPWAAAAYVAGAWVADPPQRDTVSDAGPCDKPTGRLGQESAMVPAGASSVQICVALGSSPRAGYRTITSSEAVGQLAQALNRLPTQVSTSSCPGRGLREQRPYDLLFQYPDGAPVHVRVYAHCQPGIDNGSLQALENGSVVPLIEQALDRH